METKLRCKVGDLAIVLNALPANIGRIVDVLRRADDVKGEAAWIVRMRNGPGVRHDGSLCNEGRLRDKSLQPIRGDGKPLKDKVVEREQELV